MKKTMLATLFLISINTAFATTITNTKNYPINILIGGLTRDYCLLSNHNVFIKIEPLQTVNVQLDPSETDPECSEKVRALWVAVKESSGVFQANCLDERIETDIRNKSYSVISEGTGFRCIPT